MMTEYTYQIARVHSELVRDWKQKSRNYLAERVIASLIFGICFGFGSVLSLQILLFAIDLPNPNWLMASLALSTFLSIGAFISERSPKPSENKISFVLQGQRSNRRAVLNALSENEQQPRR